MNHLSLRARIAALLLAGGVASGLACGNSGVVARRAPKPTCVPTAATETMCSDGADDDCDGYPDCLDSDCEAQSCGAGAGLTCTAGACLQPGGGLPMLPKIDNVRVTMRGDTAFVEFEPVAGALDYRIYRYPAAGDILTGANGELAIKNAIYRCAGDRPIRRREDDPGSGFAASLASDPGRPDTYHGYARSEAESVLGYVYLTPGTGRLPVSRLADPNSEGGYLNADWSVPPFAEGNAAEYVTDAATRDRLLAAGWRDDGVVFYISDAGTKPVYRIQYQPNWMGTTTYFYTDGPEHEARAASNPADVVDGGLRFNILAAPTDGAVPLHRVTYSYVNSFDVLAAGEPRYQRALHQGNQPIWSVTWPGVTEPSTFVVEALDAGCPFPGGYIASTHSDSDGSNFPSLTVDEARLTSGEVFVNGQHDSNNRPRPVARAFVDLTPEAAPAMDWFEGFNPGAAWEPFTLERDKNNGVFVFRNSSWAADFSGCNENLTFGPLLGQLATGFTDYGSSCNMSLTPLKVDTRLASDRYLHVQMASDVPATMRRYPQIMITTTPILNPSPANHLYDIPLHTRLGPAPYQMLPPGADQTIVVQPFGTAPELQIEFCDRRGWGVGQQCPQANIYGFHANDFMDTWKAPWTAMPVLGEISAFDRPVRFDVYASTQRVYVFVDHRPAGCAVLPAGRMPAGKVTVAFRAVIYHSDVDEGVVPKDGGHVYLRTYSLQHTDRKMDDLGIDLSVPAPEWDETALPCGTKWYGGT